MTTSPPHLPPLLDVTVEPERRLVALSGELDIATADTLLACVLPLAGQACELTLDLSGVRFVCAAGLGALVRIGQAARAHGGSVRIVGAIPSVRRVFRYGGLTDLLSPARAE